MRRRGEGGFLCIAVRSLPSLCSADRNYQSAMMMKAEQSLAGMTVYGYYMKSGAAPLKKSNKACRAALFIYPIRMSSRIA